MIVESSSNFELFSNPNMVEYKDKAFEKVPSFLKFIIDLEIVNLTFIIVLPFIFMVILIMKLNKKAHDFLKLKWISVKKFLLWSSIIRPRILVYFIVCIKTFKQIAAPFETGLIFSYIMNASTMVILPIFSITFLQRNFS